jgi:hypothetical protein
MQPTAQALRAAKYTVASPAFHDQIKALLATPRCLACTQDTDIALSCAVDSAFFRPSAETLARLKKALA